MALQRYSGIASEFATFLEKCDPAIRQMNELIESQGKELPPSLSAPAQYFVADILNIGAALSNALSPADEIGHACYSVLSRISPNWRSDYYGNPEFPQGFLKVLQDRERLSPPQLIAVTVLRASDHFRGGNLAQEAAKLYSGLLVAMLHSSIRQISENPAVAIEAAKVFTEYMHLLSPYLNHDAETGDGIDT